VKEDLALRRTISHSGLQKYEPRHTKREGEEEGYILVGNTLPVDREDRLH